MLFIGVWYRLFGIIADIALLANVVMLIALMSLIQAQLSLPGIAGIVLTVGMAVDANVLIFERIREELAQRQLAASEHTRGLGQGVSRRSSTRTSPR